MALYFLRHGESQAQANGVYPAEDEDPELTSLGKEQVRSAIDTIRDLNISAIIASPAKRAMQTAEIIKNELPLEGEIKIDTRLKEYDVGVLKGGPIIKMTPQKLAEIEGVEDPAVFHERILGVLHDNESSKGNILIVTHSVVGRMIETIVQGREAKSFYDVPVYPNATPTLIDTESINFNA